MNRYVRVCILEHPRCESKPICLQLIWDLHLNNEVVLGTITFEKLAKNGNI